MIQTLQEARRAKNVQKAKKAMRNTLLKMHRKQKAARKKLRKKTWGF